MGGPGHYVINNYIRGEGLLPGQRIKAQYFLTKDGKSSGHFEQDIVGTIDGSFLQLVGFNRPIEPGTVLTCKLTSTNTETAHVTGFGAEVATWKVQVMADHAATRTPTTPRRAAIRTGSPGRDPHLHRPARDPAAGYQAVVAGFGEQLPPGILWLAGVAAAMTALRRRSPESWRCPASSNGQGPIYPGSRQARHRTERTGTPQRSAARRSTPPRK